MAGKTNAARSDREKKRVAGLTSLDLPGAARSLDRIVHEKLRLGILSALSVNASLSFTELRKLLDATDGNLSVHARKLEEAGYISYTKGFEGRIPRTDYRLTAAGKKALERYLDHMEAIIQAMRVK